MGLLTFFRKQASQPKRASSLNLSHSETLFNEEEGTPLQLNPELSHQSPLGNDDESYLPTSRVANTENQIRIRSRGASTNQVQPSISDRNSSVLQRAKSSSQTLYASIDDLPQLVHELQAASTTTCNQAGQTLRRLFALSEYSSSAFTGSSSSTDFESLRETRKQMIREQSFIPSLFYFLVRCYNEEGKKCSLKSSVITNGDVGKSLKAMVHPASLYLALLVLNNVCIPAENKRYVAMHCNGTQILCHLLCFDPSCRMLAIVLVNLTFGTNAQFQQDLIFHRSLNGEPIKDTELLSSIAYALRVASLTRDEFELRERLFASISLSDLEWKVNSCTIHINTKSLRQDQLNAMLAFDKYNFSLSPWPEPSQQMFPDTARWCICALHHLTRPIFQHDPSNPTGNNESTSTAMALVRTGIIPHLFRCIRVVAKLKTPDNGSSVKPFPSSLGCNVPSMSGEITEALSSPANSIALCLANDPSKWVKETAQDAALFVIMNIAMDPVGRKFLLGHNTDVVSLLSTISDSCLVPDVAITSQPNEVEVAIQISRFQCIKARMTLAYLVGSEGNYGQGKGRVGKWIYDTIHKGRVLMMKDQFEANLLVEMLVHSLYRRSKIGPGGYSGTTFQSKHVVWAIRCLLTQACNQELFAGADMEVLNSLLVKMLAMRAVQHKPFMDSEAVEHACFSLYLLSRFGFHMCFLPSSLGKDYDVRSIVTKVLIALQSMPDTTAATHYAARQILFRLRYLLCIDTVVSLQASERFSKWGLDRNGRDESNGCILGPSLVRSIRDMLVPDKVRSGAQPRPDIFNRPMIGCRCLSSLTPGKDVRIGASSYFSSALRAAQDFSFGSTKDKHLNEATIDDIAIANNIANCADGKAGVESYGYIWSWDDDDDDVVNAAVSPVSQAQPRSFPSFARGFSSQCHPTMSTWQWLFTRNWCGRVDAQSPK